MALNNRDGWGTQFQASNQMICGILGLSSTTLWRGRGELVTAGRITFKIGKGGRPPTYHLVPFAAIKPVVPVDKSGDKSQGKTRSFPGGKRYGNPMGMRRGIRMGKRMGKSAAREA